MTWDLADGGSSEARKRVSHHPAFFVDNITTQTSPRTDNITSVARQSAES